MSSLNAPGSSGSSATVGETAAEETYSPQPGTSHMPAWTVGELPEAPRFQWSKLALMLGPGLVMGGAAIGGGDWLTGPPDSSGADDAAPAVRIFTFLVKNVHL